jgi:hypothetical protein
MSLFQLYNAGRNGFGHVAGAAPLPEPQASPKGSALSHEHIAIIALAAGCVAKACKDDYDRGFQGVITTDTRFVTCLPDLYTSEPEAQKAAQAAIDAVRQYSDTFIEQTTLDGVALYSDPALADTLAWWPDSEIEHLAVDIGNSRFVGLLVRRDSGNLKHLLAFTENFCNYDVVYEIMSALRQKFTPRKVV